MLSVAKTCLFIFLLMPLGSSCVGEEGRVIGESCARDTECASGRCDELVCKAADAKEASERCTHPLECRSEVCVRTPEGESVCGPGMRPDGRECTDDLQCISGVCTAGLCGAGPDAGGADAGMDADAEAGTGVDGEAIGDADLTIVSGRLVAPLNFSVNFTEKIWALQWDAAGNLIVAFKLFDFIEFGGVRYRSTGQSDLLLVSFDVQGTGRWVHQLGGDTGETLGAMRVRGPYLYLTGAFGGFLDFGTIKLHTLSLADVFIARIGTDQGTVDWALGFGEEAGWDNGTGLALDSVGNLAVTGYFSGTINFGGGDLQSAPGSRDAFIARFTPRGQHLASQRYGSLDGAVRETPTDLAIDGAGNTIIIGSYRYGAANFGGDDLPQADSESGFIASHSAAGDHRWSGGLGFLPSGQDAQIAADQTGEQVFATGGVSKVYAVALSSVDGSSAWSAGSDSSGGALSAAVDPSGNVYLCGSVSDYAADFGGGPFATVGTEAYVVSYARDGSFRWLRHYSTNDSTGTARAEAISLSPDGTVTIAGRYTGSIDLDGHELSAFYGLFVHSLPPQ